MKAAVFKKPGVPLQVEEVPTPKPGPGQAVIKVCRCGICATDLQMTSGEGVASYDLNSVAGHEFAGEIVEIGPGVERLKIGDLVAGLAVQNACGKCSACLDGVPQWCHTGNISNNGAFSQYTLVREPFVLKLPKTFSMIDGALIEPMACGLHGVHLAALAPRARVLVMGAGAIGLGAAFWARQLGAGRIAVMARSNRRADMAMAMGADKFLSGPDAAQQVQAALGGMPDVVFECSGAIGSFGEAINLVRPRGTIVELGFCTFPDSHIPAAALAKEITVKYSFLYSLHDYQVVADCFDAGHVEPRAMITETVSLDNLPPLFEAMRGPNNQCKVMVDPWA